MHKLLHTHNVVNVLFLMNSILKEQSTHLHIHTTLFWQEKWRFDDLTFFFCQGGLIKLWNNGDLLCLIYHCGFITLAHVCMLPGSCVASMSVCVFRVKEVLYIGGLALGLALVLLCWNYCQPWWGATEK